MAGTTGIHTAFGFSQMEEQQFCDHHAGILSTVLVAEIKPKTEGKILLDVVKYIWLKENGLVPF